MQKSGGIRAGFQGLEGMVVPVKIKALADLRSSDYRWIAGIADQAHVVLPSALTTIGKPSVLAVWLVDNGWLFFMAPANPLQPFVQVAVGNGRAVMGFKAGNQVGQPFNWGLAFYPLTKSSQVGHFMVISTNTVRARC